VERFLPEGDGDAPFFTVALDWVCEALLEHGQDRPREEGAHLRSRARRPRVARRSDGVGSGLDGKYARSLHGMRGACVEYTTLENAVIAAL